MFIELFEVYIAILCDRVIEMYGVCIRDVALP